MIRVQDASLGGAADSDVLEWADRNGLILLTHDVSTMADFAYSRIRSGQTIAGVIEIPQSMPIGQAIEDVLLIALTSSPEELENRVVYLPL